MKNIKVLGTGCHKCKVTITLIKQLADKHHIGINLEKIEDPVQIMHYGIMSTPAVLIEEQLVHKGSVPDRKLIEHWLTER